MDIIISDLIEKLDINDNDVFLIEDEKATYKIKASVLSEFFKGQNTGGNTGGESGKDGREVELAVQEAYLKWRYKGEENWTNLLDLASLKGKDGDSGREIELSKDDTYIKWKYTTDEVWQNLIAIEDLKVNTGTGESGKDGREVEIIADETYIKWRYKGEENWTNLVDLASLKGEDGKRIELSTDKNYIRWRYKGDETWTNLMNISTIKGDPGEKGEQGEKGDMGIGIPTGGTKGQVLAKVDNTDYNAEWIDIQTSGGNTGGNTGENTGSNTWEKIIEIEPTTEALSYIEFTQTDNKETLSNFKHFRILARLKAGTTNGSIYLCINQDIPTSSNAIFNLANAAVTSGQKFIVLDLDFGIEKYFQGYGIISNAATYKFSSSITLNGIKTTISDVNKLAILSPSTFGAESQVTIYAKRG